MDMIFALPSTVGRHDGLDGQYPRAVQHVPLKLFDIFVSHVRMCLFIVLHASMCLFIVSHASVCLFIVSHASMCLLTVSHASLFIVSHAYLQVPSATTRRKLRKATKNLHRSAPQLPRCRVVVLYSFVFYYCRVFIILRCCIRNNNDNINNNVNDNKPQPQPQHQQRPQQRPHT